MKLTIAELAKILKGEVIGNSDIPLTNLAKIEEAQNGDITFISNPRYLPWLYKTSASIKHFLKLIKILPMVLNPLAGIPFLDLGCPLIPIIFYYLLYTIHPYHEHRG